MAGAMASTGAADGGFFQIKLMDLLGRTLTDTRMWLQPQRILALCSDDEAEHLGLVCGGCQQVTVKQRAWARCGHCEDMLLKRVPSDVWSVTLVVNWETGYTLVVVLRKDSGAIKSVLGSGSVLYTQTTLRQTQEMCILAIRSVQPTKSNQQPETSMEDPTNSQLAVTSTSETQKVQSLKSVCSSGEGEPGVVDVGSPKFENTIGSLEEVKGDWRLVTKFGWDWEAEIDF